MGMEPVVDEVSERPGLLRRAVWWYSAMLIATGAAFALGLVAMFLFPFLPFLGMFLVFQGSAYADARAEELAKQPKHSEKSASFGERMTPPPHVPGMA
jgi:hypothetical protein